MRRIFIILAFAAVLSADDRSAPELLEDGRRLLETGDIEKAQKLFDLAANNAAGHDDRETLKRAYFFLARIEQLQMDADPEIHFDTARAYYEKALSFDPKFAAAANNLADLLYRAYGDAELPRVHALYEIAVNNGGKLEPFYLANYARATAKSNPEKAAWMYRRVLELQPDDANAQQELLRLVPSSELLTYVQKLVDAGAYDRAQKLAIEHLHRPIEGKAKRRLLAIVATTLAKQHVTREAFEGGAARELSTIDDASLIEGIKDLYRLYAAERATYDWWKRNDSSAFSLLARELADQASSAGQKKNAQWYQMFALDVTGGRDPEAFLALTDFYYRNGSRDALENLVQKYGDEMFSEKNALYEHRERNLERIYQYHVALGTIFSRLGWTSNDLGARSSIFQLEHARNTAADFNRIRGSKAAIVVNPKVIDLLAASYKKEMPDSNRDIQLRLEAAEDYVGRGWTTSAARVIQPVTADPRLTPDNQKMRYDKVIQQLPSKGEKTLRDVPSTSTLEMQVVNGGRLSLEDAAKKVGAATKDLERILLSMPSVSVNDRAALDAELGKIGVVRHSNKGGSGTVVFQLGHDQITVQYQQMMTNPQPQAMKITRVMLDGDAARKIGDARSKDLEMILLSMQTAPPSERAALDEALKKIGVVRHSPRAGGGSVVFRSGNEFITIEYKIE